MARPAAIREVTVEEARSQLDSILMDVSERGTQVVVRDQGRVVARIVPSGDPEEARRRFFAQADRLRERFADVPTRELDRLVGRAVGDARAPGRAPADAPGRP